MKIFIATKSIGADRWLIPTAGADLNSMSVAGISRPSSELTDEAVTLDPTQPLPGESATMKAYRRDETSVRSNGRMTRKKSVRTTHHAREQDTSTRGAQEKPKRHNLLGPLITFLMHGLS